MSPHAKPFSLIDAHTHVGVDLHFYLREQTPYALSWPELAELGGSLGIDRFVVFPMPTYLGLVSEKLAESASKVPYEFENRRMMVELTRDKRTAEKAWPLWMFDPMRWTKLQCEALRRLHQEFPCAGLKVQATMIQSPISNLLGVGECLLDLAEEKDWPILIHTSVHPEDPWSPVSEILKIAERRPGIRFNLAHSCRFDVAALDRIAELPNAWFDCSAHIIHCNLAVQNHPSVAAPTRRFSSDYTNPARVLADLAAKYPDKLMWGSDAPFYSYCDETFQLVSSYAKEVATLRELDIDIIERIACLNTLAFLGK